MGEYEANITRSVRAKPSCPMERAYRNAGYFLLALVPIFIAGFWVPYFSEAPNFDPSITTTVHIHAALLFGWLGLLLIQPLAIRYNALSTHRFIGRVSYFLTPLVVISAVAVTWKEYNEKLASGASVTAARNAEFLSITQLALLVTFYGLAISSVRKRNIAAHMRYMICIALILLPAGLARMLGYWFGVRQYLSQTVCLSTIDLCLIALIVFDSRLRVAARPYIVALSTYAVIEASWFALGRPI